MFRATTERAAPITTPVWDTLSSDRKRVSTERLNCCNILCLVKSRSIFKENMKNLIFLKKSLFINPLTTRRFSNTDVFILKKSNLKCLHLENENDLDLGFNFVGKRNILWILLGKLLKILLWVHLCHEKPRQGVPRLATPFEKTVSFGRSRVKR